MFSIENYGKIKLGGDKMPELTAPFVFKTTEKRIVYGPVLIPDEPDSDGDTVTSEKIEEVAHKFMEEYGNIDIMHSLKNVGRVVESYILPFDWKINDEIVIPKGSWIMGVRVTDDETWQAVKEGKLGGFSIMAISNFVMKSAKKQKSYKRVTLSDLEKSGGWVVNAVSLVDTPAVPKAKWIAIKSKNNIAEKAVQGSFEQIREKIEEELKSLFADTDYFPHVYATFPDRIVFYYWDDTDNRKYFEIGYQINEDGGVEFTSEPKEVQIEETITEVEETDDETTEISDIIEELAEEIEQVQQSADKSAKEQNGLFAKLLSAIGLKQKQAEKAGRVISDDNYKKLKQAKDAIDALLALAEKERQEKNKKGVSKMEKEEVIALIDERIEPINSKLDDVLKAMKAQAKDDELEDNEVGKSKNGEKTGKTATKSKDDEEDYKAKYEEVLKQLEKRPFSHRLAGQDGDNATKSNDVQPDRNAFGYKIKD